MEVINPKTAKPKTKLKQIKPEDTGIEGEVVEEYKVGYGHPPKNRQFGQPGANRSGGGDTWRREDLPRYQLEQMLKMNEDELNAIKDDPSKPMARRRWADIIINGTWKEYESMIHEVYGRPSQLAPEGTIQRPKEVEERAKIKAKGGK